MCGCVKGDPGRFEPTSSQSVFMELFQIERAPPAFSPRVFPCLPCLVGKFFFFTFIFLVPNKRKLIDLFIVHSSHVGTFFFSSWKKILKQKDCSQIDNKCNRSESHYFLLKFSFFVFQITNF